MSVLAQLFIGILVLVAEIIPLLIPFRDRKESYMYYAMFLQMCLLMLFFYCCHLYGRCYG